MIQQVFGIQPDAINESVALEPHLPDGWEDLSIEGTGARHYLNGRPVALGASGLRMTGRKNHVLLVPSLP